MEDVTQISCGAEKRVYTTGKNSEWQEKGGGPKRKKQKGDVHCVGN